MRLTSPRSLIPCAALLSLLACGGPEYLPLAESESETGPDTETETGETGSEQPGPVHTPFQAQAIAELDALRDHVLELAPEVGAVIVELQARGLASEAIAALPPHVRTNFRTMTVAYGLLAGSPQLGVVEGLSPEVLAELEAGFMLALRYHRALGWGTGARQQGYSESVVDELCARHFELLERLDDSLDTQPFLERERGDYCDYIEAEWEVMKQLVDEDPSPLHDMPGLMRLGCTLESSAYTVSSDWEQHSRDVKAALLMPPMRDLMPVHTDWHWSSFFSYMLTDIEGSHAALIHSFELLAEIPWPAQVQHPEVETLPALGEAPGCDFPSFSQGAVEQIEVQLSEREPGLAAEVEALQEQAAQNPALAQLPPQLRADFHALSVAFPVLSARLSAPEGEGREQLAQDSRALMAHHRALNGCSGARSEGYPESIVDELCGDYFQIVTRMDETPVFSLEQREPYCAYIEAEWAVLQGHAEQAAANTNEVLPPAHGEPGRMLHACLDPELGYLISSTWESSLRASKAALLQPELGDGVLLHVAWLWDGMFALREGDEQGARQSLVRAFELYASASPPSPEAPC